MVDGATVEKTSEAMSEVLDLSKVDHFMRKVFNKDQNVGSLQVEIDQSGDQRSISEIDAVEEMIAKASKAIEVLSTRCEILEQELSEAAENASEQEEALNQWKNLATEFQIQATTSRKIISDLIVRAESAEARVVTLEAAEAEAKDLVNLADARSNRLRGHVIAAFGQKSRIHSVIEATTLQEAAE